MRIKDILKKQGELYKNLTTNKTIQKCNETIKPPKPIKYVPYKNSEISEQEYKAIKEIEKLFIKKQNIGLFEVIVKNKEVVYLEIGDQGLAYIPKQINDLTNLQKLYIYENQIEGIENLDNLTNLKALFLRSNKITEIKNLDSLINLQRLSLSNNKITEIKNLDNLQNLKDLYIYNNQITEIKNLDNLTNLRILDIYDNQIQEIKGLDNLKNLQKIYLEKNPIKNKKEIENLRNKGIIIEI